MPSALAARMGDKVVGTDRHIVLMPAPPGPPVPTLLPFPFQATIAGGCCPKVLIGGMPAATVSSTVTIAPPHIPPPTAPFQIPPTHTGTVLAGSASVLIGGKPAARAGDSVQTCSDPAPAPNGRIQPPMKNHSVKIA
ncbi:PAAR domain-containing protein [Streptomyces sp. NPDC091376]|uniref:PAAR domain-containing protein n=1 Tax=Streptomyces sp. NPDC091376 TaxID=3365994 RepID=UPI00381F1195